MKVLHVISSNAVIHGGPSRALALMEQSLSRLGVDIVTATTDDAGRGRHNGKSLGVPLHENGVTRRYFRKQMDFYKTSLGLGWWTLRHARDFDVVHIHALFSFNTLVAAWSARLAGVPYVIRPLGTLNHYGVTHRRPWLKRASLALLEGPALRGAAAVHFTSEAEQQEAAQWGVPMRGVVIPLGIEPAPQADAALVRARYPALGMAPYVLFLSRLDPKKNVEGALLAFAQVLPSWPGLRMLMAGDGDPTYVAKLHGTAAELGLGESVVWAGRIDGDLKASALFSAKLFVLPSFSENFGIAAAEALMAGLPCVLGQGVAIAGDVVRAGAGVAVAPDPASIAAGLRQVLADESGRAAMGAAALRLAQARYSAQAMGQNLLQLYSEILER
ncbi:MAG: glycosyltransferase [Burkholderiaceae bacterium]|nr:glycosyltransferase [Burkholderiaceae bacterium]